MQVAARKPLPLKPPPSLSSTSQLDRAATARPGRTRQPTRTPGHPTTDSFTPASAGRNPAAARLDARLDRLDVQHNPRWQPRGERGTPGRTTYCNQFAQAALRQQGVPTPGGNANNMNRWFNGPQGRANGWREVPAAEAQRLANQGHAVAASWRNQNGPHGHIAIVRPGELGAGGPRIAQAGGTNFNNGSVRQGFGRHTPQYFVHD